MSSAMCFQNGPKWISAQILQWKGFRIRALLIEQHSFTLVFDKYQAQVGPNTMASDARRFCQLNIDLRYPSGYQYSVLKTIYRGYAGLDKGVTGTQGATYYFSGRKYIPFSNTIFPHHRYPRISQTQEFNCDQFSRIGNIDRVKNRIGANFLQNNIQRPLQ